MKKINKKNASSSKSFRKISFYPIFALFLIAATLYAYYRFGIVATVNGKPISRFAYINTLEKQDKKQTIKQMANEALVFQEATKKNITINQGEIDTEIASVEAEIKSQGQTLDAALTAEGMSRTDLEKQIRLQKIVEKLANPNLEITQAQIDEFIKTNKASFPASYTKDQLQTMAKTQLVSEAKNTAIDTWFAQLQKDSKVVIR